MIAKNSPFTPKTETTVVDEYGSMPAMENFLRMRGENGASEDYIYMFALFGSAVYGENVYRDVIDLTEAAGKTTEDRAKLWEEVSMKRLTCSDEAWMLLMLEDNWDVWYIRAVDELYSYMERNVDENFVRNNMGQAFFGYQESSCREV